MTEARQRLEAEVHDLARPDGRSVGTHGHERARAYLARRLVELGLRPYREGSFELPYRAAGNRFCNLAGVLPGEDGTLPPLLVGAHYDTAGPLPGADDNAAAVAILLEAAGSLGGRRLRRDAIFVLFDAEEPPYYLTDAMGSIRFYRKQMAATPHAALILDLVGHAVPLAGLGELLFMTGMESSPGLERALRQVDVPPELSLVSTLNRYVGDVSDHHAFRAGGTPYLFLSCGRWEHYHRPSDTPEKLDYRKMAATSRLLMSLLEELDGVECPPRQYDTTETELRFMQSSLGGVAAQLGMELRSREDIDRLATVLVGHFGI